MKNYDYTILNSVIASIGVLICLVFFFYCLYKLKKEQKLNNKDLFIAFLLVILSICVNTFDEEFLYNISRGRLFMTDNLFIAPSIFLGIINVTQTLTPLVTILFIAYKSLNKNKQSNQNTENQVEDFVQKVFTNDKFFTAFSTILPNGKSDEQYGLDYIPFMLQSIENKRKRFYTSANRFLNATIVLGIFFISIVIFFGYILLDDTSIGLPKNISDLKKEINIANSNLGSVDAKDSYENLVNIYRIDFDFNNRFPVKNDKNVKALSSLKKHVSKFSNDKNFEGFYSSFKKLKDSVSYDENNNVQNYFEQINNKLEEYNSSKNLAHSNYSYATKNLISLISRVENEIGKPQNELHELLKRLILSIVVISFFLAILRYTAKLYLNNYNLMVQAENEDLAIRKFYVALKNTDKNQEERKLVIQTFLEIFNNKDSSNSEIGLSKEESGVLKDLLNNLMKKL